MKVTIQQKDDVTLVILEASDGEHKSFSYNKGSVRFLRCVRALAKIDEEYSVSDDLTISQWMGFISGESDAQLPKE